MIKPFAVGAVVFAMLGSYADSAPAAEGSLGVELSSQASVIFHSMTADENIHGLEQKDELLCLASNIYFEARAESMNGKAAVGNVTRNRVNDKRWPNTYCEVVGQGPVRESWKTRQTADPDDAVFYPVKHRCQFSWYCDGVRDVIWANKEGTDQLIKMNARAWTDSIQAALWVSGYTAIDISDNTYGAVFYYAHHLVYPTWADRKHYIGVIGNHTFMK